MPMEIAEKLYVGDIVEMRKPHPCGGKQWEIVRVGADIGLVCRTCSRRILLPRRQFARQAKRFVMRSPLASAGGSHAHDGQDTEGQGSA
ncbi:MAG: DUF951 domain-containing protein [Chloroflexota bacterium]|nr:DUF951 domain-containing protein [Chloroflexota bacterium]